jgi:hypothetical protein
LCLCDTGAGLGFCVVHSREASAGWARYVSFVGASLSLLHLLLFLWIAYMLVTTDWRLLDCFDGTEPGCDEPAPAAGLSAVGASSWLLGSVAAVAACGAFVLALRVRRVAHAVPVLLLCVVSVVIAQALWLLA